jgi:heme/copper-type cytochrome/quinol oxidase subunit 2
MQPSEAGSSEEVLLVSRVAIRNLILVLLVLLILVVLFLLLRPSTQETSTTSESTSSAAPQEKSIDLAIQGGGSMTPNEISVNDGDHVNLNITSDEPMEFHLHGYDLAKDLEANEPTELSFDATITGRFEIENEQTQQELGDLLVQPR